MKTDLSLMSAVQIYLTTSFASESGEAEAIYTPLWLLVYAHIPMTLFTRLALTAKQSFSAKVSMRRRWELKPAAYESLLTASQTTGTERGL